MGTRTITIVGPGCPRCQEMEDLVKEVVKQNNIAATIEKVTDFQEIIDLGVFAPPALVIDQIVATVGRVPGPDELLSWLNSRMVSVEEIIFKKES